MLETAGLELAVLFLLTARESIWNKLQPHLTEALGKWDASIHVRGLSTQDYALLQTIKSICTGQAKITVSELADEELVDDDTLRLIIDAALLCRYEHEETELDIGASDCANGVCPIR